MAEIIENEFDDTMSKLAARLKRLRKEKSYTQKNLGDKAGVAGSYISDIENGLVNPTVLLILKLCSALEVSLEELFSGLSNEI